MTELNKETKKAKQLINQYNYYKNDNYNRNIYDLYKNPSYAKLRACMYCEDLQKKYEGYSGLVLGGNCSYFSYGFLFDEYTSEGIKTYLCYLTYANDYKIEYEVKK